MFTFTQPRGGDPHRLARTLLIQLELFTERPELLARGRYTITSDVDPHVVDLFFARVQGDKAKVVTQENARQLRALSDELGFFGFDDEIRSVLDRSKAQSDLVLRSRVDRHDVVLEELQRRVLDLERRLRELAEGAVLADTRGGGMGKATGEARWDAVSDVGGRASASKVCVEELKKAEARKDTRESPSGMPVPAAKRKTVEREFVYDSKKPLKGVIAYLARECGGNVHKLGVIEVTASSIDEKRDNKFYNNKAENVVEIGKGSCFWSNDEANSWICYDFKGWSVAPTSYSIRSGDCSRPRSWVFEGSNDGKKWEVVDRRDDTSDLNADYKITSNFKIGARHSGSFRFVRLRQTGENHDGGRELVLTSLEVFGTLSEIPPPVAAPGEFPFYDLKPLDGIIAFATRECGGNVHEKGVIEVIASSVCTTNGWVPSTNKAENVAELGYDLCFCSRDEANPWICYDFKGRSVTPTSYSIRSGEVSGPRSWVFEVSNDGKKWEVVDRREDNNDLNDRYVTRNFAIRACPRGLFRFVRLRQIGKNCECRDPFGNRQGTPLVLAALEIFGTHIGAMPRPVATPGEFPFWGLLPLDGIIAHLTRECGGNVHKKRVVNVTASSCCGDDCEPENAVDFSDSDSYFCSNDSPNSWICYNFGDRCVTPTSYSIMSNWEDNWLRGYRKMLSPDGPGGNPKSWVLEVSNDQSSWEVVDSREDNEDLNGDAVIHNFVINAPPSGSFRFVRLRQTGKNHKGNDDLCICALELFGKLVDMSQPYWSRVVKGSGLKRSALRSPTSGARHRADRH